MTSNYLPLEAPQTTAVTNYLTNRVSSTPTGRFEHHIVASGSRSEYLQTAVTTSSAEEATADASAAESNYVPLVVTTRSTHRPTAVISASGSNRNPTPTPVLDGVIHGMSYTIDDGVLYIDGSTFSTAIPTTATLNDYEILKLDPTGAISLLSLPIEKSGNVSGEEEPETHVIGIAPQQYFIGAFLPTIIAVLFSAPWPLLASALQEMEPYYQLQQFQGVSASKSLLLNYKSSINVIATVNAMRRGHFSVWLSGLISLTISQLAPLASEAVSIGFIGQGVCTATSGRSSCTPRLSVYPIAARAIQGILAFVAVLTLILIFTISRRKSGVYANPLSIASVATLFQNQSLIEEFRRLNTFTLDPKTLKAALAGQRYKIGFYKEADEGYSYGLMACQSSTFIHDSDCYIQSNDGSQYVSIVGAGLDENLQSPHRAKKKTMSSTTIIHPIGVVLYGILVAGLEVLILYYNQTSGDTAFERFMDSNDVGVSFLFTAVGVGIKSFWSFLDDSKTKSLLPKMSNIDS